MPNKALPLLLVGLGVGLIGCAPLTPFQRPAPPVPAQWPASATDESTAGLQLPMDWRAAYPDARLQALIQAALEHNRDLRLALARIEAARAELRLVHTALSPDIDLAGSAAARRNDGDVSRHFELGLQLPAFELDLWGRLRSADEAARQRLLASEEAARAVQLALIADVAEAHLLQLELAERLRLTEATLATRAETRDIIARRRDVGLANTLDVLQAEGTLTLVRAELANLRRQQATAENALSLLVGIDPGPRPSAHALTELDLVADIQPGLPAEVLLDRPDIRAAEARLRAAQADVDAARAALFPRITLTSALGLASSALAGLFDTARGTWLFQPAIRYPLFDAGRARIGVELAEARQLVALAEYERSIQVAFREVADRLAARQRLQEQLAAQREQARIQAERLHLAEARYRAGLTSFLEVLDAQRDLYAAEQGVVQLTRALHGNAVRLYQSLGGGMAKSSHAGE